MDILGYSFMSVATLFVARVFRGKGVERMARRDRVAAPVPRAANLLPLDDMDRGPVGSDVPGVDVDSGRHLPASTADCRPSACCPRSFDRTAAPIYDRMKDAADPVGRPRGSDGGRHPVCASAVFVLLVPLLVAYGLWTRRTWSGGYGDRIWSLVTS